MSGQIDTFGAYVRAELEHWGREFALHRDCEYLGHQSKNMLQVLIEHRGEMPPPNVGYKPLETDARAQAIEDIVLSIARLSPGHACALRAYYCGRGRRKIERWNTCNELLRKTGLPSVSVRQYMALAEAGLTWVRGHVEGLASAA
jgi:hypothetical protein